MNLLLILFLLIIIFLFFLIISQYFLEIDVFSNLLIILSISKETLGLEIHIFFTDFDITFWT